MRLFVPFKATLLCIAVTLITFLVFLEKSRTSFGASALLERNGFVPANMAMVGEWYRPFSAVIFHDSVFSLLVAAVFLAVFGASWEGRKGTRAFLEIFVVATVAAYLVYSVVSFFASAPLVGMLGGTGGLVGAWLSEARGRQRVSSRRNVLLKDLEEMPIFLIGALWLFAALVAAALFSVLPFATSCAYLAATGAGAAWAQRYHGRA